MMHRNSKKKPKKQNKTYKLNKLARHQNMTFETAKYLCEFLG